MTRALTIGGCVLVLGLHTARAQQVPARDNQTKPAVGTAVLSGTLTSDDAEQRPVRRAVISLTASDTRLPRMTVTDDQGRFVFAQLPAGTFTIQATKPGFVRTFHGAKRPGRPGVPVVVADGQRLQVAMKILKGAVIAGVVVDQDGRPAANAGLQLLQYQTVNGERTLVGAFGGYGYASTDDRGYYRAFGLLPGEYLVAVTGRTFGSTGIQAVTASDIQWAEQQFAASGSPRPPAATMAVAPGFDSPRLTAAPVYFPGTVDLARAELVKVAAGEERSAVNFSIQYVPTATIAGAVVGPDGLPSQNAQISLISTSLQPGDFVMAMSSASRATVVNGKFSMAGIAPGRYTIAARATMRPPPSGVTHWALQELVVDGRPIADLTLRLEPGIVVKGRIAFEGATPVPLDLSKLRLAMASVQTISGISVAVPADPIALDGTFTVVGLIPGKYRLTATPAAPWTLKSAIVNGKDALDLPVDLDATADGAAAIVTLSDRAAEISGTVLDTAGRPTPEYSIVVFPVDTAMWLTGRRIRTVRLSSTGTFSVTGLPSGEYFVCAANDFEPSDLTDAAFLAELANASVRVTLGEGEKKRQDLKVR